jgi:ATP-dependent helicase/nuclease subunit A
MAKRDIKWTQQQARAIKSRGSDVLVSASAGTGKTAVLTGRCIDVISDAALKADVLDMLVVTFTNAAAEQMRTRIAEYLAGAYAQSRDPHLRRQLLLLGGADISTIHSFCKKIITEYFFELGLDPTFSVLESDEQTLLKADALQKCVDWAWNQDELARQMQGLLQKRRLDSAGFLSQIIGLSDYLDTIIDRENWYERAEKIASAVEPFSTQLGQKQIDIVKDALQKILNRFGFAQSLYEKTSPDGDWSKKWQENFVDKVRHCLEVLNTGNWRDCSELILNYKRPSNLHYKPPDADERAAPIIRELAEGAVKSFIALGGLALFNPAYLDRLGPAVQRQTLLLIELVRRFEFFYKQAKRKIGCLDFADLEHQALKLLTEQESAEDDLKPSETALSLRQRYKYIFVDEYQDINPVQKAILDMLKGRDNLFIVGDVKQSVYAFRGAQPAIFNKQLESACDEPDPKPEKLRVDLNNNWRSRQAILDFVNIIFSRIMTSGLCGVDYDQRAALKSADEGELRESKEQTSKPVVELHILEKSDGYSNNETIAQADSERDSSAISQRQRQAAAIAKRIRKMVGLDSGKPEFQIYDKKLGGFRDVEFRDIAILMRSPAERAVDYAELLQLASIPVVCDLTSARYEATEISDFLSLLKVLDNPCRDIELAAVLRSPIFKITDTQLAQIKLYGSAQQKTGFYDCILKYSVNGPDRQLAGRLKTVIETLSRWRDQARQGGIAELLWQIYRRSGYLSFVSVLPNGRLRRANLFSLHEKAVEFEHFVSAAPTASLARFIEFIEKLQDTNRQWSPASATTQEENAVRLLSVHKSKGLEFSVVFVAELESKFSSKDFTSDCLIDGDGTLGIRIIDAASNTKLDSLGYQIIEHQRRKLLLAEEMRILYVAMTRAAERLVLTGTHSAKKCQSILSKAFYFDEKSVPDFELADCSSHLEWILYGLGKDKSLHRAFETDLADRCPDLAAFDLNVYDENLLNKLSDYVVGLKNKKRPEFIRRPKEEKSKKKTLKLLSDIKSSIDFKYPFEELSAIPAKQSVTEITHSQDRFAQLDYSTALQRKPQVLIETESDLLQTPAARILGIATHLVISKLDLPKPVDEKKVKNTVDSLVEISAITKSTAQNINIESIVRFFESDLGRAALDSKNTVYREWPFTFALPVSEWSTLRDTRYEIRDTIIIQGIIDMLIKTPEGLVVIDFKTDRIAADEVPQRAELYRPQLDYYALAASAILKQKLIAEWLYFLKPNREFKIE